jgi:hypothetical protein
MVRAVRKAAPSANKTHHATSLRNRRPPWRLKPILSAGRPCGLRCLFTPPAQAVQRCARVAVTAFLAPRRARYPASRPPLKGLPKNKKPCGGYTPEPPSTLQCDTASCATLNGSEITELTAADATVILVAAEKARLGKTGLTVCNIRRGCSLKVM